MFRPFLRESSGQESGIVADESNTGVNQNQQRHTALASTFRTPLVVPTAGLNEQTHVFDCSLTGVCAACIMVYLPFDGPGGATRTPFLSSYNENRKAEDRELSSPDSTETWS